MIRFAGILRRRTSVSVGQIAVIPMDGPDFVTYVLKYRL